MVLRSGDEPVEHIYIVCDHVGTHGLDLCSGLTDIVTCQETYLIDKVHVRRYRPVLQQVYGRCKAIMTVRKTKAIFLKDIATRVYEVLHGARSCMCKKRTFGQLLFNSFL